MPAAEAWMVRPWELGFNLLGLKYIDIFASRISQRKQRQISEASVGAQSAERIVAAPQLEVSAPVPLPPPPASQLASSGVSAPPEQCSICRQRVENGDARSPSDPRALPIGKMRQVRTCTLMLPLARCLQTERR